MELEAFPEASQEDSPEERVDSSEASEITSLERRNSRRRKRSERRRKSTSTAKTASTDVDSSYACLNKDQINQRTPVWHPARRFHRGRT